LRLFFPPFLLCAQNFVLCTHESGSMLLIGEAWSSFSNALVLAAVLTVGYAVSLSIYRLYLSPLSKFPGPKLAALTLWYEFYYDVVKEGRYSWEIAEMHKKYGRTRLLDLSCSWWLT
jgi:hypothetical protein